MRISLLKATGIFFQHRSRFFAHIGIQSGVLTVAYLDDRFMEFFFLSAVTDMFLIICDLPITSFLFIVVLYKCFIEQLMIEPFQRTLTDGLSRVEAGNPGFPRLVQVTSGGFSWWL